MATKKKTANRYPPYLLARQIAALKRLSDDTGTPVMQYIREAIDEYLEKRKSKKKRPTR
jgi:predicted DNA-binding protein